MINAEYRGAATSEKPFVCELTLLRSVRVEQRAHKALVAGWIQRGVALQSHAQRPRAEKCWSARCTKLPSLVVPASAG